MNNKSRTMAISIETLNHVFFNILEAYLKSSNLQPFIPKSAKVAN